MERNVGPGIADFGIINALVQMESDYTEGIKRFMVERSVLAVLLKGCLPEFREHSSDADRIVCVSLLTVYPYEVYGGRNGVLPEDFPEVVAEHPSGIFEICLTVRVPEATDAVKVTVHVDLNTCNADYLPSFEDEEAFRGFELVYADEGLRTGIRGFDGIRRSYDLIIIPSLPDLLSRSVIRRSGGSMIAQLDADGADELKGFIFTLGDPEKVAPVYPDTLRMLDTAFSRALSSGEKMRRLSHIPGLGIRMSGGTQ